MTPIGSGDIILFSYVNYKGYTSKRRVLVQELNYGKAPYHENENHQFFIKGIDLDKDLVRVFALNKITNLEIEK